MTTEISEHSFEDAIECGLLRFGPDVSDPCYQFVNYGGHPLDEFDDCSLFANGRDSNVE